jgi:predicted NUDIX family NTP pyrophosphohydrolase
MSTSLVLFEPGMFAVFVLVEVEPGHFAATTRDKGESKVGFPGGKVDPGETIVQAALRECVEEGWDVDGLDQNPFYTEWVRGKRIAWFAAKSAEPRSSYKEQHRIDNIVVDWDTLVATGWGNDNALKAYSRKP